MKHISIPRISFGILLTFVLAFSVQGTAEALTFGTSRSGDLATELPAPNDFDIRFSVSLKGNTSIRNDDDDLVDESDNLIDNSGYYINADGDYVDSAGGSTIVTTANRVKAEDAVRYHYNQEQVGITVTNASITHVGRYDIADVPADTQYILMETGTEGKKLSSSITLTLKASAAAVVGITISDTTPPADLPNGEDDQAPTITFTVYVVPGTSAATIALAGDGADGVDTRDDFGPEQINTLFTVADNVPLTYEVTGSGRVFIDAGNRRVKPSTSGTNKLETSSSAPVYLKMNRSSNKVKVWVRGTDSNRASQSVTFINQYADPQITGGDNQRGATRGRLSVPLEVTVKDANNRIIPGGVAVGFASSAEDSMFIPVPGTTVYITTADDTLSITAPTTPDGSVTISTTPATFNSPGPAGAIFVKTDSSGKAQTYFQLGTSEGPQRVTITLPSTGQTYSNTFFRATAADVASTSAEAITIDSGDRQRANTDEVLEDPLVVLVIDAGGRIVEGARVTFTTNSGRLVRPETRDPGVYTVPGDEETPHTGLFIEVNTDRNGKASVRYNVGDLPGGKQVFARIDVSNGRTKTKTFNINGGGSQNQQNQQQQQQQQQQQVQVNVPPSVTGTAGSTTTLRVTAPATAVVTIGSLNDTLPTGSASPGRFTGSGTSTLTLPSTARTYTLTVFVDNTEYPVSVVVNQAARETGTVSVSISPGSGAPGTQSTVTVTATDSSNQPANVNVTLSLTSGGGTFANRTTTTTVSTGTTGTSTTTLTRGSTPGTNYFITATPPDGYTSSSPALGERLIISGTSPQPPEPPEPSQPPQTAGEADSIEINGQATRSGVTLNQALAAPLVVEVLDSNGRSVADARVIFRVQSGQGRLSQRGNGRAIPVETDSRGYARATYTPLSASSTVEASVRGVTQTVTFTISTGSAPATATGTSDTAGSQTYKAGTKIPSSEVSLTFSDSRTLNGSVYTCVGSGECVISNGFVTKGEVRVAAVQAVQAKTYKTGEKIPISLTATLTFSGKHTLGGTVYTCVSDGECVVSYGILTKGEIEVSTVSTPSASDSPGMSDAKAVVGAANRPVMYWIAGGGLYRLAGASAEQIAERATDVAVGSDKLYWIEQTSETRGAIHHANLDGSDAAVVKTLTSVPKGVALANGKLYITNGWGKIQRMNVDGAQFETNFLTNLGAPLGIAVSGSRVYWTDGSGRVRSAPLQGTKAIQNIVTGSGTLGGIVADGSKVYWTEQTGERSGRIRAANLDGTGITNAYTVTATVHGLALDPGNQQLYWTNGWGKVQRGVRGSRYQDVVTGLMTPTALGIGGANTATPMPATKPVQPAAEPNYDVDGSGTVDNADLFLVSLAVGTDNAQYDVNNDGTVDDKDIALVRDNRDNGAAAAPMVVGVKLTAEQVGRLQAQIDLLIVSGDRSPAALKTLVYLQQLIATARPEQTQLLANYPNPFNPETWIPYELATDTDVRITIYAANGVVVRTLQLGQQSAGYYTDRERAAYWDGRNASGEQVASGVYFYQLETDEISSLRKMVILK